MKNLNEYLSDILEKKCDCKDCKDCNDCKDNEKEDEKCPKCGKKKDECECEK